MALIRGQQVADWERQPSRTQLVHTMIVENPPEHTRLRGLIPRPGGPESPTGSGAHAPEDPR